LGIAETKEVPLTVGEVPLTVGEVSLTVGEEETKEEER